jgi:hypothetical protein
VNCKVKWNFFNKSIVLTSLVCFLQFANAAANDSFNISIDMGAAEQADQKRSENYNNHGLFALGFDCSFHLMNYYGFLLGDVVLPDQIKKNNQKITDNHMFFTGLELHTPYKPWVALVQFGAMVAMNQQHDKKHEVLTNEQNVQAGYFMSAGIRYRIVKDFAFRLRLLHWQLQNNKPGFHPQNTILLGIESYFT